MIRNYWNEEWKNVEFDDGIAENEQFKISNYGRILNCKSEKEFEVKKSYINGYQNLPLKQKSGKSTSRYVHKLVAEHFKVDVENLQGKTRKRKIVIARQLSMYLAKELTDKSLKAIGDNFGGRDHSTVIYSCRTVQDLMETDAVFKETVSDLEKKIRLSLHEK